MKIVIVYYLHDGTVCAPRAGTGWTDTGETWHCREVQTHAAEVCPHHGVVTRLHADALLLLSFPLSVSLSGCTHMVHTGVTLVWRDGRGVLQEHGFHESTEVTFAPLSEDVLQSYINSGEPL